MPSTTQEPIYPLVVDLDGALSPADPLHESLLQMVRQTPSIGWYLPLLPFLGRGVISRLIANQASFDPSQLPYHQGLLEYLRAEKQKGRPLVLVTTAPTNIADQVAAYLGIFDQVVASPPGQRADDNTKLDSIRSAVGEHFAYSANDRTALPIWKSADSAILVGVTPNVAEQVKRSTAIEMEFPRTTTVFSAWCRALRLHQWLKNLLVFVPLLTAFSFLDVDKLANICVAFLAFSFAASGTYLLNDLRDLENDRRHPRKRNRPFASGQLPIPTGLATAAVALLLAFSISTLVSFGFFLMLLLYVVLTSAYSLLLKQHVLTDVLALSLLYTLRILAGAVAADIPTSSWLLAFSVFIFLSLALVKRCAELVSLGESGCSQLHGRGYQLADLAVLWPMGVGAALSAVVVFGLFISAPETQLRYATPQALWLVAVGLIHWLGRLWITTSRGNMCDDPVVYALTNKGSLGTVITMLLIMVAAHTVDVAALIP